MITLTTSSESLESLLLITIHLADIFTHKHTCSNNSNTYLFKSKYWKVLDQITCASETSSRTMSIKGEIAAH